MGSLESLRELWPLDAVHPLPLPLGCWSEALHEAPGTRSWLASYVMREIDRRDPSLLSLLVRADPVGAEEPTPRQRVALLRRWGRHAPVAALRVAPDGGLEWLAAPPTRLDDTG